MRPKSTPTQLMLPFSVKRCGRCHELLPLESFGKNRRTKDGLNCYCRPCALAKGREWWEANRDKQHVYAADYRTKNPEKCREATRKWAAANKDRVKAYRVANREYSRLWRIEWRARNRERWREYSRRYREKYPERTKERFRRYRATHPERGLMSAKIRRARKHNARRERVDYREILRRDGLVCHICGGSVARNDVHFDHVIPLSKGGEHSYANIKVAHSACNLRKGARMPPQ